MMLGAFTAGLVLFTAVVFLVTGRTPAPLPTSASAIGGSFEMVDHRGRPFTDQDLKGRPHLIFFGFTHCPDVCPAALFEVSEIMKALGDDAKRVGALFVTVDPERDTQEALANYLTSFDPHLVALTGTPEQVRQMEKTYRVYSKKIPLEGDTYTMDHTAIVYLMDREGRFVAPFSLKRRPEDAAAELRRYL